MKMFFSLLVIIGTAILMSGGRGVLAAPHFTFTPATGSYSGDFDVTLGVDSGTEKVVGIDIEGVFDATKLELSSISKATQLDDYGFKFTYSSSGTIIDNQAGSFRTALLPIDSSIHSALAALQPLLVLHFKGKANGTASVSLTCQGASVVDTNIINQASADVVVCASNQSGSYTISSGSSNPTATPVPNATATSVPNSTATPTRTSQLPQTGNSSSTLMLMAVGLMSLVGALFLKRL